MPGWRAVTPGPQARSSPARRQAVRGRACPSPESKGLSKLNLPTSTAAAPSWASAARSPSVAAPVVGFGYSTGARRGGDLPRPLKLAIDSLSVTAAARRGLAAEQLGSRCRPRRPERRVQSASRDVASSSRAREGARSGKVSANERIPPSSRADPPAAVSSLPPPPPRPARRRWHHKAGPRSGAVKP